MCNARFCANTYTHTHVRTNCFCILLFWSGWCAWEGVNGAISVVSSEEDFHSQNFFRVCSEKSCASYSLGEMMEEESFSIMLLVCSCYGSSRDLYLRHLKRMMNYLEKFWVKLLVLICIIFTRRSSRHSQTLNLVKS